MRFSGLSFSYNVAYAICGGLTPLAVPLILERTPLAPAHYVAGVCCVGFAVALYLLGGGRSRLDSMSSSPGR